MVDFNTNFPLRDLGFSNALSIGELPRHRWYFMKEGFSPVLVDRAVADSEMQKGELLFDPFSGSGTVPLAGAVAGLKTQSFEINPFLRFLSATKLSSGKKQDFLDASRDLVRGMDNPQRSPLEGISTFTEGNPYKRWLFPLEVIQSYEGGRQALAGVSATYRDLLRLALLGATMDCCNAVPDGKCLRYVTDWQNQEATRAHLADRFRARVELMADDLEKVPLSNAEASVIEGDSRKLITHETKDRFRLCVTSPPYLNSFDYSDVYRPELFLGGFVDSNKALMNVRMETVRSHVQAQWPAPKQDDFGPLYTRCISELRDVSATLWSSRIPDMVQAYFEDMQVILTGLKKRALPNASVWLVVSTSAYGGYEVPVDLILADVGRRSGWFLREVGVLRYLRSSPQHSGSIEKDQRKAVILRESVVILDAAAKRRRAKVSKVRQ